MQLDTWNNELKTTLRISGNNGFISGKKCMKILIESIVFDYKYLRWLYILNYITPSKYKFSKSVSTV